MAVFPSARPVSVVLGGIAVVAAGALLAAVVAHGLQTRTHARQEREFLSTVRQALAEHRANVQSIHDLQVKVMAAADAFLALPADASQDAIYAALAGIMNTRPYDSAFTIYQNLPDSPEGPLVSDPTLRAAIAVYARRFQDLAAFKRDVADAQWDKIARPVLYEKLDVPRMAGLTKGSPGAPVVRAGDAMLRNVILDRRMFANDILRQSESLLKDADALAARIDRVVGAAPR